jgi:hypothetical protein
VIVKPQGEEIAFEVQGFRKYCLLNGFDDIGLTLRQSDKIKANRLATKPWLTRSPRADQALRGLLAAGLLAAHQDLPRACLRFAASSRPSALVADDDWLAATGEFQRAATVGSEGPVTLQQFKAALAGAARECGAEQRRRWSLALAAIAGGLQELPLRLPDPVIPSAPTARTRPAHRTRAATPSSCRRRCHQQVSDPNCWS